MMKQTLLAALMGVLWTTLDLRSEVIKPDVGQFQNQCQLSLNEPWRTIPWEISLLEAQRLAAKEKKPLYIWAMDGHPLGCT